MDPEDLFNPRPCHTDAPQAGYYAWRRTGRPDQPVRIWFGPPVDEETGEEMDRSWRWQMLCSGSQVVAMAEDREGPFDPIWSEVWPQCSADPIPRSEYEFLVAKIRHARLNEPDCPFAEPGRKIDLRTAKMPF